MTWVKVCGITRAEDAAAALTAGADAVGFVTDPGSPRAVSPERVSSIVAGLGAAMTVLVTVDLEPGDLLAMAREAGVGGVQPHGRHAAPGARLAVDAGLFVLHPVRAVPGFDLTSIPESEMPLLDTADPGRHGGTGRTFDWSLAVGLDRPFVLAGGLGPVNVAEAVRTVRPWGVDASSRLELKPGVKDSDKVRRFIEEAKGA